MKLEVGMYYRYKGIIGKYYKPDLGKPFFTNQHKYTYNEIANYGKFSHNIIDLIEEGDYVNGLPVRFVEENRIDIGQAEDYFWLKNQHIKSIVTKEQFEQMEYKVGE